MLRDRGTVHVDERAGVSRATAMDRARQQAFASARLAENENGREPMRSRPLHQAADGIAKPDDTRAAPKKLIEMQHGGDYSATDVFRSGRRTELARFVLLRARTVGTTKTPSGARCFVVNTGPAHGPSTKRSQPPGRSL